MMVASVCTVTTHQIMTKKGESVNLTCALNKLEWRTDKFHGKIFTGDKYVAKKNYLVIRNFTVDDKGIYKCYDSAGSTPLSEFNVTVEGNFVLFCKDDDD